MLAFVMAGDDQKDIRVLVRMDSSVKELIDDVHHDLRLKSQNAAILEMLKAGHAVLLKHGKRK